MALAVLIPLSVGLVLRLLGLRHGEPQFIFHPDVAKQARIAINIYRGNLDLRRGFNDNLSLTMYPFGTAAIVGHAMRAVEAIQGPPPDGISHVWRWDFRLRMLAVGMLLAAVAITLLDRLKAWSPAVTGLVGLMLLVEPITVLHSHYGMNDVPLLATLLVAWVCAGHMPRDRRWPWWALASGLALGIGFGIKYQAVLGLIFPAGAVGLLAWRRQWGAARRGALAVGIAALGGALLTTPMLVQDPLYFCTHLKAFLAWQACILDVGISLSEKMLRDGRLILDCFLGSGRFVLLAVIPGLWIARRRGHLATEAALQAGTAVVFALLLTAPILFARDIVRETDLIPVFAFLTLAGGFLLQALRGAAPTPPPAFVLAGIAVATLAVMSAGTALRDSLALRHPDTRLVAQAWAHRHLLPGTRLIREHYTLPTGRADVEDDHFRNFADDAGNIAMRAGAADVLIASSLSHRRFFESGTAYFSPAKQEQYRYLHERYRLVAAFNDRPLTFSHPRILVYANPDTPAGAGLIALTAKK